MLERSAARAKATDLPTAAKIVIVGFVQVRFVGPWDYQHLVWGATPERTDDQHVLVVIDDPFARLELGLDESAQKAVALEPGETRQLVGRLTRDEGHRQKLPVGMFDRRPSLPAAVHNRLAVAQAGGGGVLAACGRAVRS